MRLIHPSAFASRWRALALLAAWLTLMPAAAQDPVPGDFHTTPFPGFNGGIGKIPSLPMGTNNDQAYALALQPDGRILIAGRCIGAVSHDFCVARLRVDGSLDTDFDGPGGSGNGRVLVPVGSFNDYALAMAVQPDGKILLAGTCESSSNFDFCIARLNPDGTLDATFSGPDGNGNGKFLLSISTADEEANAIALQPDGRIVLAGRCGPLGGPYYFCAARLMPDGSLDASFDGPGGAGNGRFVLPQILHAFEGANGVAVQPDGKILLAGRCGNTAVLNSFDFCVARLNVDGSFDSGFDGPSANSNGRFGIDMSSGSPDAARTVALQPDGKIVLAGACDGRMCVLRLNADGSFDSGFDGPSGTGNGRVLLPDTSTTDEVLAIALQPDGKLILAGNCVSGLQSYFCMARLNGDGTLDASFDGWGIPSNGKFLLPIGAGSEDNVARAVALQNDGRIVVAGYCYSGGTADFCVARLNGGPFMARQCSLDIDGDGAVIATVDLLIGTRVALGMTGNAVIGGISFAPHATRNTWASIRSYLVSQCGMAIAP